MPTATPYLLFTMYGIAKKLAVGVGFLSMLVCSGCGDVDVLSQDGGSEEPARSLEDLASKVQRLEEQGEQHADALSALEESMGRIEVSPGTVAAFAGGTPPAGWLLADGAEIKRADYPDLFSAIGVAHGNGDAIETFLLPDYRGRFLRGVNHDATRSEVTAENPDPDMRDPGADQRTAPAPGGNSGNTVGSVQSDELMEHAHGFEYLVGNPTGGPGYVASPYVNNAPSRNQGSGDSVRPAGGAETRPVNAYVNYIIKY